MSSAQSKALVTWEGDLQKGHGHLSLSSGIMVERTITWAARTHPSTGGTNPEELIAAAHAGCYAMALSNNLAKRGKPATRLDVTATCILDQVGGNFKITAVDLHVRGEVPGLDRAAFEEAAREAEQACLVSNALRNNVSIHLQAELEGTSRAAGQ